jgi:Xaa-Pro aminopeptidase
MSDVELRFTREEYAARLAKTRRAMAEKGLDLIIVSDPSNMAWLTGYDGWSFCWASKASPYGGGGPWTRRERGAPSS